MEDFEEIKNYIKERGYNQRELDLLNFFHLAGGSTCRRLDEKTIQPSLLRGGIVNPNYQAAAQTLKDKGYISTVDKDNFRKFEIQERGLDVLRSGDLSELEKKSEREALVFLGRVKNYPIMYFNGENIGETLRVNEFEDIDTTPKGHKKLVENDKFGKKLTEEGQEAAETIFG